jgi:hypothetical protein
MKEEKLRISQDIARNSNIWRNSQKQEDPLAYDRVFLFLTWYESFFPQFCRDLPEAGNKPYDH